ncbi:MAG: DMT family transporter [Haloferacaceae archaeon]
MDRRTAGSLFVVVSALGASTLTIVAKMAYQVGLTLSSILAFRFLIATVLVWALLALDRANRERTGAERLRFGLGTRSLVAALALGGVVFSGMSGLYFAGLTELSAATAIVVFYTAPVFVLVFSAAFLDERVTRKTVTAAATALAGVVLIAGANPAGVSLGGVALVLAAAVGYAVYTTLGRATLERVDSRVLTGYVMPATAAVFVAYGAVTGSLTAPATLRGWAVVAALAVVGTVVPVFAYFEGLKRIGASRAGVLTTLEPLLTVAMGVAVLGEPLSPATVAGGALVLTGAILVQRS